jgi:LruC domain-containing protein
MKSFKTHIMKATNFNYVKAFILLISIISCESYDTNEELADNTVSVEKILDIPDGFDFSTHKKVTIIINDPEKKIVYDVYKYSRENNDELENDELLIENTIYKHIISGITNNGNLKHTVNIPNNNETICIRRKSSEGYEFSIIPVDTNINFTHANRSDKTSKRSLQTTYLGSNINQDTYITGNAYRAGNFNTKGYKLEVTGNLTIAGQLNLKNSNSIVTANDFTVSGTLLLKGGTINAHNVVISGWLNGPGTVNYCVSKTITGTQNTSGLVVQQQCGTDTDGDGVNDPEDAYPNDSEKAFQIFTPNSTGKSTLAYEDLWPSTGDYDFNDVSIRYRTLIITNADNNAVQIDFICNVGSNYANFTNAFGIELEGVDPSQVGSVTGNNITENYLTFNANGTESGQDNAVIIFTDNTDNFLTETTVSITLNTPISTSTLGAAPFNPFIIANKERAKEIHLAGYNKTNLGDSGTYITGTGFPWGLSIINEDFDVPKEGVSIIEAYNYFDDWATSGGNSYSDWYSNNAGYRNDDKIDD